MEWYSNRLEKETVRCIAKDIIYLDKQRCFGTVRGSVKALNIQSSQKSPTEPLTEPNQ